MHSQIIEFNIEPVDFVFLLDLQHLLEIDDIKNAFISINKHIRKGGCLAVELGLPSSKSYSWLNEIYHPRKINYTEKKVWKTGEGNYDSETKRTFISQKIFIEDKQGIKSFEHKFHLQLYEREIILKLLADCGFSIKGEYKDHKFSKYDGGNLIIIEGIKS